MPRPMQNYMRNRWIVLSFSLFFLLLFTFFSYIHHTTEYKLLPDRLTSLNDDWAIFLGDMHVKTVDLPAEINVGKNTTYFATTTLPKTPDSYDHVLIRASLQDITVYLDGEMIHQKVNNQNGRLRTPLTSSWELVYLPYGYQDKELTLQIRSETNAFAGTINPIQIGSSDALLFHIIKNQGLNFVVGLILFILAMSCLLIALSQRKFIDNRLLYLGLLSLTTSLWIFGESKLLQFITGNPFIIGGLSYLMVPLIAGFIALYIKESVTKRFITLFRSVALIFAMTSIAILFLQQFNYFNFIELIAFVLLIILILSIIQIGALTYEYHLDRSSEIRQFSRYLSIFVIAVIFEIVLFFTRSFQAISSMLLIGVLVFFSLLFIDTYRYLKQSAEQARRNQLLETLAYKDLLTNGLNRTAYERDLNNRLNDNKHFRLILVDLNDLKFINDTFGHTSGDQAIMLVYKILLDAFIGSSCYRIGGDEFVILSDRLDKHHYQNQVIAMRKALKDHSETLPYTLDVAIGSDLYNEKEWPKYTHFYHHVDQLMYKNKIERKKRS